MDFLFKGILFLHKINFIQWQDRKLQERVRLLT